MREVLHALRARWMFAVIIILLGAAAISSFILSVPPQHQAQVKLFVSAPTGASVEQPAAPVVAQRVESYADLSTDPATLQGVIERIDRETSLQDLQSRVDASVVPETQTIAVTVRAGTAEEAEELAGAFGEELVELVDRLEAPADDDATPALVARLVGQPVVSSAALTPDARRVVGLGVLLTLVIAVMGSILRHRLDRTVKSREDVQQATGSAVLSTLPFEPSVRKRPLLAADTGSWAEALRVLRTNLQFTNLDAGRQTLMVCSAAPNEGKTLVATNLAVSMAQSGRSVLLVDADLRKPHAAALLGLENTVGLVTVLIGRATIAGATQVHASGVSFIGTGPTPPNPADVLQTRAMRDFLQSVRKDFDVVILDAPPILPVADASILLGEVDGVLLLARHGSTDREQLSLAASRIEPIGGRLLGTVLNGTPRRSDVSYGYGYRPGTGEPEPGRTVRASSRGQRRASS